MMSNLYKIFSKIILGRITKPLDEQQPIEQAGFRSDFSTVDHIHVVKQVIEKYNEYGKSYYILFVDYNKAFDSLYHSSIYNALEKQGVHAKYINIIRQIYNRSTARIQLETVGDEFKIEKGVRQGDPLSPKLFAAVLEDVFRELKWDNLGLNINGKMLNHLRFADDIVIFAEEPQILQAMLKQLSDASAEVGLTINFSKTKAITNSTRETIAIEEQEVEYVEEYIYLGHLISPQHLMPKEIQRRVNNTWSRYWSLKEVVKSKSIPIREKKKVYDSCILPVLTYGCQTWSLTKSSIQKLKVCQQGMERSMLGIRIKDRCRLVDMRKQTGVADVTNRVKRLKWKWTGHTMRNRIEKWTRSVIEWYPRDGKRRRGRQHKRWEDDLPQGWRRSARHRKKWHDLEEAYVKGQPD